MTAPEQVNQKKDDEEELVTIDGLQFKPYLFHCMEVCARMEKYDSVKEWLNDLIVPHMLVPYLEGRLDDYASEVLQRVKKDGYY